MSVTIARPIIDPTPETPAALAAHVAALLEIAEPALAGIDADERERHIAASTDERQRGLDPREAVSREDLTRRAAEQWDGAFQRTRSADLGQFVTVVDEALPAAEQRLQAEAEARRSVPAPVVGPTAEEQAALAKEGPNGLLGNLIHFTLSNTVATRGVAAAVAALTAVLTLTEATDTGALLDEMEHGGTPSMQRRAEALLRGRLGALRVTAAVGDSAEAREAARAALQRFEAVREARVPADVRQAEQRERAAWARLAEQAIAARRMAATWAAADIDPRAGAPRERLDAWRQERQAILNEIADASRVYALGDD